MRRATIFRLLGAVLVIGVGAYSAYWRIAANRLEAAALAWQASAPAQRVTADWHELHVNGYPLALRLALSDVALKDGASSPAVELRAPALAASLRPWDFHRVSVAAADGVEVAFGPDALPFARVSAEHADGAAAIDPDGGTTLWLSLDQARGTAGLILSAAAIDAWLTLRPNATTTRQDAAPIAFALDARAVTPPLVPPGFADKIDDFGFGVTVMGAFPAGPLRQAAAAWRDAGGTVELDHLHLRWGDMEITGSGTLALDNELQPVGGFSGGVSGFDQLLSALVASGRIKASDARVARLALTMLAKAGPDGRPEISTSLTIQNGEIYLGPAKLGPAPRIDW